MSNSAPHFASDRAPLPARLGIASIEAWPAVGGGLLTGIAEPMLAGAAPVRAPVKTVFLRLDDGGSILCMLPYVALETETRACIRALLADELSAPEAMINIIDAFKEQRARIPDLHPTVERSLQALAAATRELLVAAAAEAWNLPAEACAAAAGEVRSAGGSIGYRDLAADAALLPVPHRVRLCCGSHVFIG